MSIVAHPRLGVEGHARLGEEAALGAQNPGDEELAGLGVLG